MLSGLRAVWGKLKPPVTRWQARWFLIRLESTVAYFVVGVLYAVMDGWLKNLAWVFMAMCVILVLEILYGWRRLSFPHPQLGSHDDERFADYCERCIQALFLYFVAGLAFGIVL